MTMEGIGIKYDDTRFDEHLMYKVMWVNESGKCRMASLEALFAEAAVDEMTGDMEGYAGKVRTVAAVAELLGVRTRVAKVSIELKK